MHHRIGGGVVCLKTSRETCRTIENDGVSGCRHVDCSLFYWTGTLSHRYVDTNMGSLSSCNSAPRADPRISFSGDSRVMKLGVPAARQNIIYRAEGGSDSLIVSNQ